MDAKVNYALVGLFVVGLGGGLIAFALWLGFAGKPQVYETYVAFISESVSGLNEKAPVKYRGVDVGRVREISLDAADPSRVRLLLDLKPGTPVKTDTIAILSSQGLTGIAFVELTGGSRETPLIEPAAGQAYPEIKTGPSLLVRFDIAVSSLLDEMAETARQLKSVASKVAVLLDSNNVEATTQILSNVRKVTESLAEHIPNLAASVEHVNQVSGDAARVSKELPDLLRRVRDTLGALEETATAIESAAGDVDRLADDAREDLREVTSTTLPEVAGALGEVRELAQTLNRLAQDLERDPALLLRGRGNQRLGPGE